jgi:hypothetical protein
MSCNFCPTNSFPIDKLFFYWKDQDWRRSDFVKTISQTSLLVWYEQETPTLKVTKSRVRVSFSYQTKEGWCGKYFAKNKQFNDRAFQQRKQFMKNRLLEQKLQLFQYEVFHPYNGDAK